MQFGTPVPLLIGLILIIGAVGLFFLDKIKPGYGRDSDKIYSVLLLIAGMCALGELQLGIFPSFQLLIMAGMLITLLIDNIRNRVPLEPVRPVGGMPPRRPERRPVDRRPPDRRPVYRAELDDWDRIDDRMGPRGMPPARPYEDDRYRPRPPYDDRPPMRRLNPGEPPASYGNGGNVGRPPVDRPSGPPRNDFGRDNFGGSNDPRSGGPNDPRGPYVPPGRPDNRPDDRGPRRSNGGTSALPPRPSSPDQPRREGSSERTLNVRPYSEAPNAGGLPSQTADDDYLDFRPVDPPDAPKDDPDWR
ncbi:MAG: Ycf66 family protein [Cyanobacteria bacterium J06628_6]